MPSIEIPLHTVIELVPKADGTMAETRFYVDVDKVLADSTLLSGRLGVGAPWAWAGRGPGGTGRHEVAGGGWGCAASCAGGQDSALRWVESS